MMDIVIDTNVLVAGLLSPFGACGEIVRMVSAGKLTLSFDARILSEYNEVLRRRGLVLKKKRSPRFLTILCIVAGPLRLPLCSIRFLIRMMNRFSKSLLRVKLHVLLQEIKNISLLNDAKALKSFHPMSF